MYKRTDVLQVIEQLMYSQLKIRYRIEYCAHSQFLKSSSMNRLYF